jgi:VWFA-related protein
MSKIVKLFRLCLLACSLVTLTGFAPFPQTGSQQGELQVHITQVDTSRFPQVTVYVSVTDEAGKPVGIDPKRIMLYEGDQPIEPSEVRGIGKAEPLTTLFVMDVSGSMNEAGKLDAAKVAARAYVAQMRPGDQAGLLIFNTKISYVQPLTQSNDSMVAAINNLKAGDDTAMYDALTQAVEVLQNVPGRKAIIALTDGMDNRSTHKADDVIQQIGPSGLSISTIGLGEPAQGKASLAGLDEAALKSLAERAGGIYGYANDSKALRELYERYGQVLQSEYVITYLSPSSLRDGVNRTLKVSLAEATGPVAQTGYNPGGLVPEVAERSSWPLFGAAFAGLLVLLFAPALIARGIQVAAGLRSGADKPSSQAKPQKQPKSRIRLH